VSTAGGLRPPPNLWRIVAFTVLLGATTWIATGAVTRWERGLEEDRVIHRALAYARAAARLTESGRGTPTPHLRAFGNAVGAAEDAADVLRMVVIDTGTADEFGVRRDARTLWALDGTSGPVAELDQGVADKANHLQSLFEDGKRDRPIRLTQLVEVAAEPDAGMLRVAAYAPIVVDGELRGLAAALLRLPAPDPERPTAIWLLALVVLGMFVGGTWLLPDRGVIVTIGVLAALALVLPVWVPSTVDKTVRDHLGERADDMLAVQAKADTHEAVALVSPVPDREVWSPDGALRLERVAGTESPDAISQGAERVGGETASVHIHPDVDNELNGAFDSGVLGWAALAALLLGLCLLPVARLLHNIRLDPGVYTYLSPAVIGLLVLVIVPLVTGIGLSFYRYHLEGNAYELIGFGNFAEILAPDETADVHFWWTLGVTLLWTSSNVILHVTIGLGLALLLNRTRLHGKKLYRVLLVLPWAVPSYITALLWRSMFVGKQGPVNSVLGGLGISPVSWFDDSFWTNFIPNLVTNTWLGFPFMMVVALGALQSIPGSLYEAAELDGASAWDRFRHITVPLLKPALLPAIILGTIWTFNMFNVIYLVSMGAGDTEILITEAYRAFHEQHRHGYAAAYSVMIFCILLAYTAVTTRVTKASEGALA